MKTLLSGLAHGAVRLLDWGLIDLPMRWLDSGACGVLAFRPFLFLYS